MDRIYSNSVSTFVKPLKEYYAPCGGQAEEGRGKFIIRDVEIL
jgi:hypothetical protein